MKLFLSFLLIFLIMGCAKGSGQYDAFAQCLTDKGAKMYGTGWCSHCQNQKKEFGSSFQYVDFIDCDLNQGECVKAGITGYPSWVINGEKYAGEQPLYRLASLTKCSLK